MTSDQNRDRRALSQSNILMAFTLLLTAQTALSAGTLQTSGCASWGQKACVTCYNSIADQKGKGCLITQKSPNCVLYNRIRKGCQMCAEGYARDFYNAASGCQPHSIDGCLVNDYQASNKRLSCYMCKGGNPNLTQTACVPFDGSGKSKNCFAGTIFGACGYCNKGFSVDDTGKCVPQKAEGCARINKDGKCLGCDFMNGYFVAPGDVTQCVRYKLDF